MRIEDLLIWPGRKSLGGQPESDALREEDALLEAALVDVRIDAINSTAWLLFDLKGAINLEIGNTAVVAVHGVTDLQWESDPKGGRSWCSVMSWMPEVVQGMFVIRAQMLFGPLLQVRGKEAEFYVGDVPGGDDAPPNFSSASDKEVREGMVQWPSEFESISTSIVGPWG